MIQKEDKHFIEYLILILGLSICAYTFYLFKYNHIIQIFTSFAGSLFYILWGIIHHALENRLTKHVFLEYIVVGLFALSLLLLVVYS